MKKRQQITWHGEKMCATIPQKIVESCDISTKRFFEWKKLKDELIGTLRQSETVVTTRVLVGKNNRFLAEILPTFVKQYHLIPTRKGGPVASFEWDDDAVTIRIGAAKKK